MLSTLLSTVSNLYATVEFWVVIIGLLYFNMRSSKLTTVINRSSRWMLLDLVMPNNNARSDTKIEDSTRFNASASSTGCVQLVWPTCDTFWQFRKCIDHTTLRLWPTLYAWNRTCCTSRAKQIRMIYAKWFVRGLYFVYFHFTKIRVS